MRRAGLVAVAVAALAAAANEGSPAQTPATITVKASRRGFQPSALSLRRGETTHLVLVSADGEHCFAIDELRIEKRPRDAAWVAAQHRSLSGQLVNILPP